MSKIVLFCAILFCAVASGNLARGQFLGQQSLSQSSYVIDMDGKMWAWGWNLSGQLGLGDIAEHNTPVQVPLPVGVTRWVLVAGGASHAIAIGDSDKLYTWGLNDKGQIGNGTVGGLYASPVLIKNPITVTSWKWVSAGTDHCEALDQDGILYAWGNNSQGQLGVGNTKYLTLPEVVEFPTGVTSWAAVAAGPGYTMMINSNGLLYGCGMDSLHTFGAYEGPRSAGTYEYRVFSPLATMSASFRSESLIGDIGEYYTGQAQPESTFTKLPRLASVADGGWHSMALGTNGTLWTISWTNQGHASGQLGLGDTSYPPHYREVALPQGVTQFVAIAGGLTHSLAIGNDGWLYAWGDNTLGQVGTGTGPNVLRPTRVMQVCDPIAMTGNINAPGAFAGPPYEIELNIHNTSPSISLSNADASLVGYYYFELDSGMDHAVQSPIAPSENITAEWSSPGVVIVRPPVTDAGCFAYVRAIGSAPLLVPDSIVIPEAPHPSFYQRIWADVVDSITNAPLPGAELAGLSETIISDSAGRFNMTLYGGEYDFSIFKENYGTSSANYVEPPYPDSLQDFQLAPSGIIGTFTAPSRPFAFDSITKVYFPDSTIGYALGSNVIFKSVDTGSNWSAVYVADANLHDIKFLDVNRGWAVGDSGEILNTTDAGETWQVTRAGDKNLRAIALIDQDTAWAIGDSGTLLKKSGDVWRPQPPLTDPDLTAIHFFDQTHGVIVADSVLFFFPNLGYSLLCSTYYIYDGVRWNRGIPDAPIGEIRTAYYASPTHLFLAGDSGRIFDVFFSRYSLPTYTTHAINSLYFLNQNIGYALGDSGSSLVTYDGGASWASMPEFPHNATSINFWSITGHGTTDGTALNYNGQSSPVTGIVRGQITVGNPPAGIMGGMVRRFIYYPNYGNRYFDTVYTNEQGNFVFTGVDPQEYEYDMSFTDSDLQKTELFTNISVQQGDVITLNYNDYTPPPPDTILADVKSAPESNLSLDVSASQSIARIKYSIPSDGIARLVMQDILGRTVRTIWDGFSSAGLRETDVGLYGLSDGAYYVTLQSGQGIITKAFAILR